jgi:hypothetical protein
VIVDGTGAAAYHGGVAVAGGRIGDGSGLGAAARRSTRLVRAAGHHDGRPTPTPESPGILASILAAQGLTVVIPVLPSVLAG